MIIVFFFSKILFLAMTDILFNTAGPLCNFGRGYHVKLNNIWGMVQEEMLLKDFLRKFYFSCSGHFV